MSVTEYPIPRDHVMACSDHGVVTSRDYGCPCCEHDVEARPGAVQDVEFTQTDLRWQINPSTMDELLPALTEDAEREGVGPVFVAVAEIPRSELAYGYTEQERWFNVAVVETGNRSRKLFKDDHDAMGVVTTIQSGGEYLEAADEPEPTHDDVKAQNWKGVVEIHCGHVEYEQVDASTLHIHMSRFPSDNAYKKARKELGYLADANGVNIQTLEAGGRFQKGTVEVSVDD